MQRILVATGNPGKLAEYAHLLSDLNAEWVGLKDLGIEADVEETGTTFEANAIIKAQAYAARSGLVTMADDSGLVVDALDGEPGVYSARYGGPGLDDEGRYRLLLQNMSGITQRAARFVCVVAACTPGGAALTARGTVEGRIAEAPRGDQGFGYDPVFFVEEKNAMMAELPPAVKNAISHRANALANLRPRLDQLLTTP